MPESDRPAFRARAVERAYASGWALVRGVPEPVAAWNFAQVADLAWHRDGKGVRRLESNLRRVAPDLGPLGTQLLVRAALRSYARYWREVFRLPRLTTEEVLARVDDTGFEHIQRGADAGRGVILALPHMGNWDLAGAWLVARGHRFTTVAERLEPAGLFDRFVEFRVSLGMEVLPLSGGDRPPYEVLQDRLRAGGVVCLLADRDLTSRGVAVQFFGQTATMPAGPALLALRTGAALLPVTLWYPDRRRMGLRVHPPVPAGERPVEAVTQDLADVFAHGPDGIAAHPADWHMLQRLWQADLDPDRPPAGTPAR